MRSFANAFLSAVAAVTNSGPLCSVVLIGPGRRLESAVAPGPAPLTGGQATNG